MTRPLRVLVDGRSLSDDGAWRGVGGALRDLLGPLSARDDTTVRVLLPRRPGAPPPPEPLPDAVEVDEVRRVAPGRWRDAEHAALLPLELARRARDVDVVWSPAADPPGRSPRPWVQTLHDLAPLHATQSTAPGRAQVRRARRLAARLPDASAVVCPSRATAREATDDLGLPAGRVHVVGHGVHPVFSPGPPAGAGVRERPYALLVGEWAPRRRPELALEALEQLAARGGPDLDLVLTGRVAPWVRSRLDALVGAASRPDRVVVAGHLPRPELVDLYRGAVATLVPSRWEGFGLPALEALACGCPVVAFPAGAVAEVLGGVGTVVDDGDVDAMAREVRRLHDDPGHRGSLVTRGLDRARGATWSAAAAAYRDLMAGVAGHDR